MTARCSISAYQARKIFTTVAPGLRSFCERRGLVPGEIAFAGALINQDLGSNGFFLMLDDIVDKLRGVSGVENMAKIMLSYLVDKSHNW